MLVNVDWYQFWVTSSLVTDVLFLFALVFSVLLNCVYLSVHIPLLVIMLEKLQRLSNLLFPEGVHKSQFYAWASKHKKLIYTVNHVVTGISSPKALLEICLLPLYISMKTELMMSILNALIQVFHSLLFSSKSTSIWFICYLIVLFDFFDLTS